MKSAHLVVILLSSSLFACTSSEPPPQDGPDAGGVAPGDLLPGAECLPDAAGGDNDPRCAAGSFCFSSGTCTPGTCTEYLSEGATCGDADKLCDQQQFYCSSAKVCTRQLDTGAECDDSEYPCRTGDYCQSYQDDTGEHSVCRTKRAIGASCSQDLSESCVDGAFCDIADPEAEVVVGTCVKLRGVGESCLDEWGEAAWGLCDNTVADCDFDSGTCVALAAEGSSCDDATLCAPGLSCNANVCSATCQ